MVEAKTTRKELWEKYQAATKAMDLKACAAIQSEIAKLDRAEEDARVAWEAGARHDYVDAVATALKVVKLPKGLAVRLVARKTETGMDDVAFAFSFPPDALREALATVKVAIPSTLTGVEVDVLDGKVDAKPIGRAKGVATGGKGGNGKGRAVVVDGAPYKSLNSAREALYPKGNPNTGKPWTPANAASIITWLANKGHKVVEG